MKEKIKEIHLALKKEWWDKILSGEKTKEYRSITPYYIEKFCLRYQTGGKCVLHPNSCEKCVKRNDFYIYQYKVVVFHLSGGNSTMKYYVNKITKTDNQFVLDLGGRIGDVKTND